MSGIPKAKQLFIVDGDLQITTKPSADGSTLGRIVFQDTVAGEIGALKVFGGGPGYYRLVLDTNKVQRGISFRTYSGQGSTQEGGSNIPYTMDVQNNYIALNNYTTISPLTARYPTGDVAGSLLQVAKNSASASYAVNDLIQENTMGNFNAGQATVYRLGSSYGSYGANFGYRQVTAGTGNSTGYGFHGMNTGTTPNVIENIRYYRNGNVNIPLQLDVGIINATTYLNLPPTNFLPLTLDQINNRVGINNVTPTKTLDIIGDGLISGALTVGGHTISNSLNITGLSNLNGDLTVLGNTTLFNLQVTQGIQAGTDINTNTQYKINNISVLTTNTLGSGILNSSLTSVGTLVNLDVLGNINLDGEILIRNVRALCLGINNSIAIGYQSASLGTIQGTSAVAIGNLAGRTSQGNSAVAIGSNAGTSSQGIQTVAVGVGSGNVSQAAYAVAVGEYAGQNNQATYGVGIGSRAGQNTQGAYAVAIGTSAGSTSQGSNSIAIGRLAGNSGQLLSSVAIGYLAGQTTQGNNAIGIGYNSGNNTQGAYAVAIGDEAGKISQATNAVAIGHFSGYNLQGNIATAIGMYSGTESQGQYATAIGNSAGRTLQGQGAVAIGSNAGISSQGAYSIAIGLNAGYTNQHANSIILYAGGLAGFNSDGASRFYVNPVRNTSSGNNLCTYNSATSEISYTQALSSLSVSGNLTLGSVIIATGSGSPESVVTASPGSMYLNSNGGSGTSLYIKESGTGNTGWVGK